MTRKTSADIAVEMIDPGVYFVTDEDGPIEDQPALDAGPWSVRADAEYARDQFLAYVDEENAQVMIDRAEWDRLF